MEDYARLRAAIANRPLPLALVDLDRFDANAVALEHRAAGMPIRVASKCGVSPMSSGARTVSRWSR